MEERTKSRDDLLLELSHIRRRLSSCQTQRDRLRRELAICESRERRRLAEYLHDHLGPLLYFAELKVLDLRERSTVAEEQEAVEAVARHLKGATDEFRSLLTDLYPQTLIHLGLAPALTAMAEDFADRFQADIELYLPKKMPVLPDDISHFLFRAARELVINALKHARTKKIGIFFTRHHPWLKMSVQDDGIGFNPDVLLTGTNASRHFGLNSIRERLEQLGGRFHLESGPGKGTKITLWVPFFRDGIGKERAN